MQPGAFSEYLGSNTDGGQSQKDPRPPQKSSSLENIYEIHFQGQERDRDPNLLFFFFFFKEILISFFFLHRLIEIK